MAAILGYSSQVKYSSTSCFYYCNFDFVEYKSFVHLKHYALQRIFIECASKMPSSYLYDQYVIIG
ncbi:hypothetical protein D9738_17525 [Escherichia sp. E10V5]|nr:hypothetical protein D9738_17525 [Escherichia sp. E10V5]